MFIRPNWRDPAPYKLALKAESASNLTAWEFLRRNPKYQADTKELLREVFEWCFNNPKDLQETSGYSDSPRRLGVMFNCFEETCTSRDEYWKSFFEEKWGMQSLVLPTDDYGWEFFRCQDLYLELFKPVQCGSVEGPLVLIPVDLSIPLETLLQMVEDQVRQLRGKGIEQGTVTPRTDRVLSNRIYIDHLRILDAFADGATVREMANVLAPGAANEPESRQQDKRIKAAHKAALNMQNKGYLTLLNAVKYEAVYELSGTAKEK